MKILYELMKLVLLVIISLGTTVVMNKCMKRRGFRVRAVCNCTVIGGITALLFLTGGMSIWTVKGIVMALILLYASVQDLSTHEADDFLWVMLLILAFVGIEAGGVRSMVVGGLVILIPQLAIAISSKSVGIGGADIKISTAAAVILGFHGGVIGYMLGLVFAIVFQTIYNRIKKRSNQAPAPFPLLPFLSTGLMIGYFI